MVVWGPQNTQSLYPIKEQWELCDKEKKMVEAKESIVDFREKIAERL